MDILRLDKSVYTSEEVLKVGGGSKTLRNITLIRKEDNIECPEWMWCG